MSGRSVKKVREYKGIQMKAVVTNDKKSLFALTSSFTAAVKAAMSKADVKHITAEGPVAMCWIPKLAEKRMICMIPGYAQIIRQK